jgi:hypothetical protein
VRKDALKPPITAYPRVTADTATMAATWTGVPAVPKMIPTTRRLANTSLSSRSATTML